jgi:hypothetical protein
MNGERPYGYQFVLRGSGKVSIVCSPPRYMAASYYLEYLNAGLVTTIEYGKSLKIGNIVCNTGYKNTPLTCKTREGSGFSISKISQKVFRS